MQALNHETHVYLAVTLSPASPYLHDPSALAHAHPAIVHLGQVGQMHDVQLLSVSKQDWDSTRGELLASLKGQQGVGRVDIQTPQTRVKRGGEEL